MTRSKLLAGAVTLAAGGISAAVVGAVSVAGGGGRADPPFDYISNAGVPVRNLAETDARTLVSGGGKPELHLLGKRGVRAFYTAPGRAGGRCFATGSLASGRIGVLACPSPNAPEGTPDFPSKEQPILDMSPAVLDPATDEIHHFWLAGFAADGVAKVAIIDSDGVVHAARVSNNIYFAELPRVKERALIAVDTNGLEVYRRTYDAR